MRADDLATAIEAERRHRELPVISHFSAPAEWENPYAKAASSIEACAEHRTVSAAGDLMHRFLDPVLATEVSGTWSPSELIWV